MSHCSDPSRIKACIWATLLREIILIQKTEYVKSFTNCLMRLKKVAADRMFSWITRGMGPGSRRQYYVKHTTCLRQRI